MDHLSPLTGIQPSGVFPTEIRGWGNRVRGRVTRLEAAVGIFLLPRSVPGLGIGPSMLMAAVVAAVGAGVSQWLAPATKGMSLTAAAAITRTSQRRLSEEPTRAEWPHRRLSP